ncbi:hypothetical protein E2C01_047195 [Portunus trituberculatus]|uniref:Uncharacterized protein n=1 Tax=Portunus trituberculatus TaxID=210409 RepID=A0A5B7G737_PORTR|nr:hypothetical protein [Portunus trituberculatus]
MNTQMSLTLPETNRSLLQLTSYSFLPFPIHATHPTHTSTIHNPRTHSLTDHAKPNTPSSSHTPAYPRLGTREG